MLADRGFELISNSDFDCSLLRTWVSFAVAMQRNIFAVIRFPTIFVVCCLTSAISNDTKW